MYDGGYRVISYLEIMLKEFERTSGEFPFFHGGSESGLQSSVNTMI